MAGNERTGHAGRETRAPLDLSADEFRAAGHRLIDDLADFYESLAERPVTRAEPVAAIRDLIGRGDLPEAGADAAELLAGALPLLRDHSLHNGHPRFFAYITSSAAPLGALADLLAAAINANVGKWDLSPVASEIETQTVRWLAQLIGYPVPCGGIMVSGGNMANILGFFAARRAKLPWDVRAAGVGADARRPAVYASRGTHTWIEKAADLAGLGTDSIRWIATDREQRIRIDELERQIALDRAAGRLPILAVGTAGNVSTGAIDPLGALADICREQGLWFHVDGAYGAPAAVLPEAPADLRALREADSLALDPHKWLYCPIEAACTLVRDPQALAAAFSYRPPYYHFASADEAGLDYYEHGVQNSRGFRALKVWLCLRQAGRAGYERMIREDIALARRLDARVREHPELEPGTQHLSIATFRYRPRMPPQGAAPAAWDAYLDDLNTEVLSAIQRSGRAYLSNAVIDGKRWLRACIVNFRTRAADVDALAEIAAEIGRAVDSTLRPAELR